MVSVCGVVVATIALVCALSVYNGFNDLVSSLFSNFDPELKIMPRKGKVFDPTSEEIRKAVCTALFVLVRYCRTMPWSVIEIVRV